MATTADTQSTIMTEEDTQQLEIITQSIQRDINCLSDDNRATRKRAITKVARQTVENSKITPAVLQALFDVLLKPLLKLTEDQTEKCRELSSEVLTKFMSAVPDPSACLPYLIPVLVSRLGQPEVTEPTEEIRAQLVSLLILVVEKCPEKMKLYIDDLATILARTIVDPFPEVKKLSCTCTAKAAKATQGRFKMVSKNLCKPLLTCIGHQHAKVRVSGIAAVGAIIMYGDVTSIQDVMTPLAQKTMDHSPTVRRAVIETVGEWMMKLDDRYSYWHKLLPLIMSGLSDEVQEVAALAKQRFHEAGDAFVQENEKDLKDLLDFGGADLVGDRLPLGCRHLVFRNLSKFLPGLLKDCQDWTTTNRRQALKLLYSVLEYAEENITINAQTLLTALFKCVRDEESDICAQAVSCVELTGKYVKPDTWVPLLLPLLNNSGIQPSAQTSHVIVLGGLVRGSNKEILASHLESVVLALTKEHICGIEDTEFQQELLITTAAIIDKAEGMIETIAFLVFSVLQRTWAAKPAEVDDNVKQVIKQLAGKLSVTTEVLYRRYTAPLIKELEITHKTWTKYSLDCKVFANLLAHAGPVLGGILDLIMPIFVDCFSVDRDLDVRLKFFSLVGQLLVTAGASLNSEDLFSTYAVAMIKDIIVPNLVWQSGRSMAALRMGAASCLWALFKGELVSAAHLGDVVDVLLPQVVACLDDDVAQTRLVMCYVVEQILILHQKAFQENFKSYDQLHSLYPEMIKRLDDNSDDVRAAVLVAWKAYFQCIVTSPDYDTSLYQAHIEAILKGLLIHLDDPDSSLQIAVEQALNIVAPVWGSPLQTMIKAVQAKHRNPEHCQRLLDAIDAS